MKNEKDRNNGKDRYLEIPCNSINGFFSNLHVGNREVEHFRAPKESDHTWIFRGQACADWHLVPKALRNAAEETWGPVTENVLTRGKEIGHDDGAQVYLEHDALQRFMEACDRQGVLIPEDSGRVRSDCWGKIGKESAAKNPRNWPDLDLRNLMAFAQHHGLPTRLLDWSFDPNVAAYFAASEVFLGEPKPNCPNSPIAIWALCIPREGKRCMMSGGNSFPIQIVYGAGASNPNLVAQRGIFTLVVPQPPREDDPESGDPRFFGIEERLNVKGLEYYPLLKFTLPVSLAGDVLTKLFDRGYDGGRLFPGVKGAIRFAKEQYYWGRPVDGKPGSELRPRQCDLDKM